MITKREPGARGRSICAERKADGEPEASERQDADVRADGTTTGGDLGSAVKARAA